MKRLKRLEKNYINQNRSGKFTARQGRRWRKRYNQMLGGGM